MDKDAFLESLIQQKFARQVLGGQSNNSSNMNHMPYLCFAFLLVITLIIVVVLTKNNNQPQPYPLYYPMNQSIPQIQPQTQVIERFIQPQYSNPVSQIYGYEVGQPQKLLAY